MLQVAEPFLERKLHPRTIVTAYNRAMIDAEEHLKRIAKNLDPNDKDEMLKIIRSTIGTKFTSRFGDLLCELALKAVLTIKEEEKETDGEISSVTTSPTKNNNSTNTTTTEKKTDNTTNTTTGTTEKKTDTNETDTTITTKDNTRGNIDRYSSGTARTTIDIKRFARVERIPGGQLQDSRVLDGVIVNKDVLHPRMRRRIENPRIICLDCPLEYNKGESQTNIEISKEEDFEEYLRIEEEYLQNICNNLIKLSPDIVVTEKGCAELAQHFLMKAGVSVLRRMRKTDNVRLARCCGATIGHRTDLIKEEDVGTDCGLFQVRPIAEETFSFFEKCKNPKACSIILRGGSKDVLSEMDRNLQDAMAVARNIIMNPRILPGGGATEMALSVYLQENAKRIEGVMAWPYKAVANALEVIPRTLISNCGEQPIRVLTKLRAKHSNENDKNRYFYGINGNTGEIVSMEDYGVWEPFVVKNQTIKTAIESSAMLLRIDDVVSGLRNKDEA